MTAANVRGRKIFLALKNLLSRDPQGRRRQPRFLPERGRFVSKFRRQPLDIVPD